jgi:hypothetical protein
MKLPAPASEVEAVIVPLLVNAPAIVNNVPTVKLPVLVMVPETLMDGMTVTVLPLMVLLVPLKVWVPVLKLVHDVELLMKLPAYELTKGAEISFQAPFTVTSPVNVLSPVLLVKVTPPLLPIVVVPVTVETAEPKSRVPPVTERFPAIGIVPPDNTVVPEPVLLTFPYV